MMPSMDSGPSHPRPIQPRDHAVWNPVKMGKSTIYHSERLLVGVNALEPGQQHALHAHPGIDKVYLVVTGVGQFLLETDQFSMGPGEMLVAPADVPHGVKNDGEERLMVLTFLAPGPQLK
ncbi:MAG: cupin domain-containing protein [Planctomycetota bacterium]|nr:cupin domain-containing protein [Planctomycetota bacterium]